MTNQSEPFVLPESFKIEFDGIDAEHGAMVDLLNEFAKEIEHGDDIDYELAFANLINIMKSHFANEEAYMAQYGYTGLEWHRDHHNECIVACENLVKECGKSGKLSLDIVRNCFHQVVCDVAQADLKFKEFLVGEGIIAK